MKLKQENFNTPNKSGDKTLNIPEKIPSNGIFAEAFHRYIEKYVEAGTLPSNYQKLVFDVHDLGTLLGEGFQGLPTFIPQSFLSAQYLIEPKKKCSSSEAIAQDISKSTEEDDDLDLTGCPLESPFDLSAGSDDDLQVNTTKASNLKTSLAVTQSKFAKLLLNLFILESQKLETTPLPCFFLCDGLDPLHTILIGAIKERDESIHFIANQVPGLLKTNKLPSLNALKKEHSEKFQRRNALVEAQATAIYPVLEHSESFPSSLIIHCHWKNPLTILEAPKVDAACLLNVQVSPGEDNSCIPSVYKELLVLKRAMDSLTSGEITWYFKEMEESMETKIQLFIEDAKKVRRSHPSHDNVVEVGDSSDMMTCIEAILTGKKQNMDFTEKLWTALTDCTSYTDLKAALVCVTEAISKHEIQPVVLRRNTTSLGNWIKYALKGSKEDLPLDGIEPLMCFIEIGLQKLQKDYCSLFIGLGLTTQDMLSPFMQSWDVKEEALDSLCLLHAILELVVLCHIYLHLPQHILGRIARKALKDFRGQKPYTTYKFSFPVPLIDIQQKLKSFNPSEWQVCLTSSSSTCTKKTALLLSSKNFSHLNVETMAENGLNEDQSFYSTTFIYVKDKI